MHVLTRTSPTPSPARSRSASRLLLRQRICCAKHRVSISRSAFADQAVEDGGADAQQPSSRALNPEAYIASYSDIIEVICEESLEDLAHL